MMVPLFGRYSLQQEYGKAENEAGEREVRRPYYN